MSEQTAPHGTVLAATGREQALTTGRRLEYFTIAYNSLEGVISVAAGIAAGSVSLIGFGIDSAIEVTSAGALLWRLGQDADPARRAAVERTTLRIVGVCFVALSLYVLYEAAETLILRQAPDRSLVGIALAAVSVVVMPLLARAKRRVAASLDSNAMHADSRQTDFCTYLSAILLGGLLLNAVLGWWWADSVAALAMVPIIAREGIGALRGRACDTCSTCH